VSGSAEAKIAFEFPPLELDVEAMLELADMVESCVLRRSTGRTSRPPCIALRAIELKAPFASSMLALMRLRACTTDAGGGSANEDDSPDDDESESVRVPRDDSRYEDDGLGLDDAAAAAEKLSRVPWKNSWVERRVVRLGTLSVGKGPERAAGAVEEAVNNGGGRMLDESLVVVVSVVDGRPEDVLGRSQAL